MKFAAVIVDTNVVVSGLLINSVDSPVARILDGMLAARFTYLLSPALLDEYRRVLLRPGLRKLHGLSNSEVDLLLTDLTRNAVWRETQTESQAPDPGDNHLWQLLDSLASSVLVTGDHRLRENPPVSSRVLTPREFIESLGG